MEGTGDNRESPECCDICDHTTPSPLSLDAALDSCQASLGASVAVSAGGGTFAAFACRKQCFWI